MKTFRRKTPTAEYIYPPLQHPDSIRLLELLAGEASDPIRIALSEVRFQDNPEYEALSYTWGGEDGDNTRSCSIDCDGRYIRITKNCEAALRQLRSQDKSVSLWIDAICIDQENLNERGHQVGLMRDIYSKASQVLIWLGESSEDVDEETGVPVSDIFLNHVSVMAREFRALQSNGKSRTGSRYYQEILSDTQRWYSVCLQSPLLGGMVDIHRRRWWSRIWVLQEAILARSAVFVCSQHRISYSDIELWYDVLVRDLGNTARRLAIYVGDSSRTHLNLAYHLNGKDAVPSDNSMSPAVNLLHQARYLEASEIRDKVFGILGLSAELRPLFPVPDYQKPVSEIYTEVAKAFLERSNSLSILHGASLRNLSSDLPSWVPDWSVPTTLDLSPRFYSMYNTGKGSRAEFEISGGNKELRVKGKIFDLIDKISLAAPRAYEMQCIMQDRIPGWQKSCEVGLSLDTLSTRTDSREVLWRTLCWDTSYEVSRPAPATYAKDFEQWHSLLVSNRPIDKIAAGIKALENPSNFTIFSQAPLCVTQKGFLAGVPFTTKAVDCIAVLTGGNPPFILRPTGESYRLIGPCYVHGIMDGEVFPEDPNELEWISIR
ncbi:Heterokaryon incompatibility protein 6 OR allele [Lachnellula suecica]|uniref:Heterokaryon incompatibility protein 6 OR allele n=1 Tax=Lachnellula suecica TaxID=602035 RepID=A0A8T9C581_9HELO|nr:Heterokaryon incompatibility protein 6 OR allele [Lachnellula suecica]